MTLARHPTLVLVGITLLWGLSFPWTKDWQQAARDAPGGELLSSLTLIALRMPLAILLLGLWQPGVLCRPTWREHAGGLLLGSVFFAGFLLQTWGLAWTTPALSAFFTALACAWVPLAALALGQRVALATLAGLGIALAGCAVLVEGGWRLGPGESLTLAASLLFTGQILLLDRLGRTTNPSHLTGGFMAATGLWALAGALLAAALGPGLPAWAGWTGEMLARPGQARNVGCLAFFASVLAFHGMNTYQPLVSPSRAALIYLLEPVFASLFSLWWDYDRLSWPLVAGGTLILAGNLVVEMPTWLRARPPAR